MSVNYATKYSTLVSEPFTLKSITDADCGHSYKWLDPNSKTIVVSGFDTVDETPYKTTGDNRFGETQDIGDHQQEMTCSQAPAFSFTIDAKDASDRAIQSSASAALKRQLERVTVPNMDRYRIKRWALGANVLKLSASAPTKATIGGLVVDVGAAMTEENVPLDNRTLYIGITSYKALKLNPDWLGVESLGKEALEKGVVGEFDGNKVKPIPDKYLPEGVWFFIKHKDCTADPVKVQMYKIREDAKGYSGPVVEGLTYYDSFVIGDKGDGIGVCANSEVIMDAPEVSVSGGTATCTLSAADEIWYTVDGTNPRYSKTKKVYSSSAKVASGQTIKVVGVKVVDDKYGAQQVTAISPMVEKPYA